MVPDVYSLMEVPLKVLWKSENKKHIHTLHWRIFAVHQFVKVIPPQPLPLKSQRTCSFSLQVLGTWKVHKHIANVLADRPEQQAKSSRQ